MSNRSLPRTITHRLPVFLLVAACASSSAADDWPGFRGPDQRGAIDAPGLFEGEGPGLELAWKAPAGSAYSSLAIAGGRVFTLSHQGDADTLVALDVRTGTELWQTPLGPLTRGHDGSEDGPSSTPAVHGDRLFAFGALGDLVALAVADGEELWRTNVHQLNLPGETSLPPATVASIEGGPGIPFYGHAASPLLAGDLVVIPRGESEVATLAAFDRASGQLRWTALPGKASYQSPVLGTVGDAQQIVFWADAQLAGVTLDGEVAWTCPTGPNGTASAVPAGEDRFLLVGDRDAVLLEAPSCREVWSSRRLKGGMSSPVIHQGVVYGFDRAFLSALDLETGAVRWKSRPPGGNGLALVHDRLAVFAADGQVVLVKASPEGYEEEARLQVTERESLTWPAFADGRIFVRDRTHIAAVRITDEPMQLTQAAPALVAGSLLAEFVQRAAGSDRAQVWVDEFFRQPRQYPLREGDLLHFVYRGEVDDVGLVAPWLPEELGLERLAETDFFYRTVRHPPAIRIEYGFRLDFDDIVADPLNPRRTPGSVGGSRSELLGVGEQELDFLRPYTGAERGSVQRFTHMSAARGDEREIAVYLAHGVNRPQVGTASTENLPLVLIPNGLGWLRNARLVNSLDHLIAAGELPRLAVAFVPRDRRVWFLEEDGELTPAMAKMLASELVPELRRRFGVGARRDQTLLLADGYASSLALYTLVHHSEVFGGAALFSYPYGLQLEDGIVSAARALGTAEAGRVELSWNGYVGSTAESSDHAATAQLRQKLEQTPLVLSGGERADTDGWGGRRRHVIEALRTLLPSAETTLP